MGQSYIIDDSTSTVRDTVCLRKKTLNSWEIKNFIQGRNKKILHTELGAILEDLVIVITETENMKNAPVIIFCDSQEAPRGIEQPHLHKRNLFLRGSIYRKTKNPEINKHHITISRIPSHSGLVGNERGG